MSARFDDLMRRQKVVERILAQYKEWLAHQPVGQYDVGVKATNNPTLNEHPPVRRTDKETATIVF